jgi:hypothetical protein
MTGMPVFLGSLAVDSVVIAVDQKAECFGLAGRYWHENLAPDRGNRSALEKNCRDYRSPTTVARFGLAPLRDSLWGAYP